jgi:hypothetical protein
MALQNHACTLVIPKGIISHGCVQLLLVLRATPGVTHLRLRSLPDANSDAEVQSAQVPDSSCVSKRIMSCGTAAPDLLYCKSTGTQT